MAISSLVRVPLNIYTLCKIRIVILMDGTTPPSPATPKSMGAKMLLKALLAVRDTREGMLGTQ